MYVITLANQKGGVAKTTTANALANGLFDRGYSVLGIDLDPQSNFTLSVGFDSLAIDSTIYDVFRGSKQLSDVIYTSSLGFDVVPGGLDLAAADMEFVHLGREKMLSKAIATLSDRTYDYVIIDTPPTLGILTANALIASNNLIVPMCADIYSLQGLSQLSGFLTNVRENGNPRLNLLGLLVTKYHQNQILSRTLNEQIDIAAKQLSTKVFSTRIRESVALREIALAQADMFREAPRANATLDYKAFIDELLGGLDND